MDLKSKVVRVTTTKTMVSGKEEEIGVVSRVVDNNRIAVTVPISVPKKLISAKSSFSQAGASELGELLFQNYSNFKRSGEPARFMRYVDGSWADVEADVFEVVKKRFLEGIPSAEAEIGGSNWLFDLHRMIELNLDTGSFRSIAWIDVNGMCFFPKTSVSSQDGENDMVDLGEEKENGVENLVPPKIEIEIKITENLQKEENEVKLNKRKREVKDEPEGSSSNLNARRKHVEESEFASPRWPKTRLLGEQDERYKLVKNLFVQNLAVVEPGAVITAIHQCVRTGSLERAQFDNFQKQVDMVRRARGNPNVVMAWFGTTAKGVECITSNGFEAPGMIPGSLGVGIYLSPVRAPRVSATMAQVDENGEKHIILCRVILGKCEKIESGTLRLNHSRKDFDTGVNDLNDPQWYGLLGANLSTRIIPDCILSYRPANHVQGQVTGVASQKHAPNTFPTSYLKLISKLRSSLPPPKVNALLTLYCSLKDGRLQREGFLRELRSVVGDEVLRSTIQEIRG